MNKKIFPYLTIFLITILALVATFWFVGETSAAVNAAPLSLDINVIAVQPNSAPNDLDTLLVISGTDFTAGM